VTSEQSSYKYGENMKNNKSAFFLKKCLDIDVLSVERSSLPTDRILDVSDVKHMCAVLNA
jgi:hypothetical protein